MLRKWEQLPERMQNAAVRPYYEQLQKKKISLFMKRTMDVVLSSVLLVLSAPALLVLRFGWIRRGRRCFGRSG